MAQGFISLLLSRRGGPGSLVGDFFFSTKKDKEMNEKYQELLRKEFEKELSAKTNWGRNEVLAAFDRASSKAALRLLDQMEKVQK